MNNCQSDFVKLPLSSHCLEIRRTTTTMKYKQILVQRYIVSSDLRFRCTNPNLTLQHLQHIMEQEHVQKCCPDFLVQIYKSIWLH